MRSRAVALLLTGLVLLGTACESGGAGGSGGATEEGTQGVGGGAGSTATEGAGSGSTLEETPS
jgi:hypothetical protein